jgi:hypothetical protein
MEVAMIDWQIITVLVIIVAATVFVLRSFGRSLSKQSGCGSGCGKCETEINIPKRKSLPMS